MVLCRRRVRRLAGPNASTRSDTALRVMSTSRPSQVNAGYDGGMSSDPYDRPAQTFPKLPSEMIDRIKPYGRPDSFDGGAYLFRVGDRNVDFFLILEGAIDILESNGHGGHALVVTHEACEFTGELDHLSGRAVLVCARAAQPTKVIRVTRSALRRMVSAEPDIGEIILRAFILRRVGLIQHPEGGIVLVGSTQALLHGSTSGRSQTPAATFT